MKWALAMENWHKLSTMEKANIHRTALEVTALIAAYILTYAFTSLGDDADDPFEEWLYSFISYQTLRLSTELLFFSPKLDEPMKILRSPTASMSFFENTIKLVSQMWTPFDEYERGPWKGKPKIHKTLMNMVPAAKQVYRIKYVEDMKGWLE